MKVGDIVKSFDFNGVDDCYIIGEVTSIDGELFTATVIKQVFGGYTKVGATEFSAPLQGCMFLDNPETPRISILG